MVWTCLFSRGPSTMPPLPPLSPGRCRNINLEPGRSPCGSHSSIKPDFITLIALRVCCISKWSTMGQDMWKYPIYNSCSTTQGLCCCSSEQKNAYLEGAHCYIKCPFLGLGAYFGQFSSNGISLHYELIFAMGLEFWLVSSKIAQRNSLQLRFFCFGAWNSIH